MGLEKFAIKRKILGEDGFLMVLALVDSKGRLLDVSAKWPSTLKPKTDLRQSKLFLEVEKFRKLLQGPSYKLSNGSLTPQYVLGDLCYPLLPWLLTPYNRMNDKDSFGSAKRAFNCAHAREMRLVGDAFGRLRVRWQLLSDSRKWKGECVEYLPYVIVTCCLLHNFLIKSNEPMPVKEVRIVEKERADDVASDGVVDQNAIRIRDALAMHLSRSHTPLHYIYKAKHNNLDVVQDFAGMGFKMDQGLASRGGDGIGSLERRGVVLAKTLQRSSQNGPEKCR
ncbi:protein ALP1-like [Arachis stenosperma]|uniref:protein ALP1-like n=1 Tax=Arachis stenosperma TaxID=217475 RepID=UPI0025ACBD27|nr:protein ALP1-like [Arachis stenosperma]